jgi:serine/threonine protein kinase
MEGGTVSDVLHRLTATEQRIILYGTALAVQYLHRHVILHRDIKPNNILLNSLGYPCFHDLGFSKLCQSAEQTIPLGCLQYRSPEMSNDKLEYSFPSDIYALGITFCAILNGTEWGPGLSRSVLYEKVANHGLRPPLKERVTKVQRDLSEEMSVKDPGERLVIDEVISRLNMEGMWPKETDAAFVEFQNWYGKQQQELMDMESKQQCESARERMWAIYVAKIELESEGGTLLPLKVHLADSIGLLTGVEGKMNEEMKNRVLEYLENHESLDPEVFSGSWNPKV